MHMNTLHNVLVTGGAGYVGSVLVPKLLHAGYKVTVLDWFLFQPDVFQEYSENQNLVQIKGDIRDEQTVRQALEGQDAVIHLACISNDPSFEMDPKLGKSINYDASLQLFRLAKEMGVKRLVYASSSSVYGVKDEDKVTENLSLEPLTDYSKFKAMCEPELLALQDDTFIPLVLRPATVCGYSPRLRLDLTVNILTCHAIEKGKITVFGGDQTRPNIHIADMTDLYVKTMEYSDEKIAGKTFNAGYDNFTVSEIAQMVKNIVGDHVEIIRQDSDDKRSYRVDSSKINHELGFSATHSVEDAIRDLQTAFTAGKVPDALTDPTYYNIKMMQLQQQPA